MTVAELIAKLQRFPPSMEVVAHDGEYEDFWEIEEADAALYPHGSFIKISPFKDDPAFNARRPIPASIEIVRLTDTKEAI